ncbi:MAG: twin-arginine translocase subunit TatC [Rubricoccaceae bacterium]|nr:twin-arginine translocase subunit TatC [Rubricoccaceae bacterium]
MAQHFLKKLRRKSASPAAVLPDSTTGLTTGPRESAPGSAGLQEGEMPFLEHLEELRWRIIKALASVVVCAGACLFFTDWVIDTLLLGPTRADFFVYTRFGIDAVDVVLQNRTVTGQFFAYFGTVIATGVLISSPLVIFQMWRFVEPGLYPSEKKGLRFTALFATLFFVVGVGFGYLVLTPLALQFFAQFEISPDIVNEFDISKYFSMVLTWSFGAGVLFELPVAVYFLARLGIATPEVLRKGRKYAVIIILILAAMFTPPDPLSQIIMAIPLLLLYELSIRISAIVHRRRERELQA